LGIASRSRRFSTKTPEKICPPEEGISLNDLTSAFGLQRPAASRQRKPILELEMVLKRPASRIFVALLLLVAGVFAACASSNNSGKVHVLTWRGDVNPVMARYVDRGLKSAEKDGAPAAVLRLDTPGGLDSSMRQIVQRIEAAKVPVIVYVAPGG